MENICTKKIKEDINTLFINERNYINNIFDEIEKLNERIAALENRIYDLEKNSGIK